MIPVLQLYFSRQSVPDPRTSSTEQRTHIRTSSLSTLACKFSIVSELDARHTLFFFIADLCLLILLLGSAKHLDTPEEQLTTLAGSFGYVAPEVLNKTGHGKAVDIWSTGCVSVPCSILPYSVPLVG